MSTPPEVAHGFGFFPHRGLTLTGGQRATVFDEQGRAFLDAGGASYGTMNVGHAHPRVVRAIANAATGLSHTSQVFAHPARSHLVERLRGFAGPWAGRVFLSNSGAEAVECALKVALATTGRDRVLAFEGGFHGRTLGALSLTHKAAYREPFAARLGETAFVPFNDPEALAEAIGPTTAAVIVEPVQGEAGARVAEPAFLRAARDLCDDRGALLILDEVQTGLARTGTPLALHAAGIEPDLVCLAKSLAAGLPLGATLAREDIGPLKSGLHGSTFGGSPLACAVASEVLGILHDEGLAERAAEEGQRLVKAILGLDHPLVRDVRGKGLLVGVELASVATPVLRAMQGQGVLALPAGDNVVRFLPPLVVDGADTQRMAAALGEALDRLTKRFGDQAVSP